MTVTEKLKELPVLKDGYIQGTVYGIVDRYGLTIQWICGAGKLEERYKENDKIHITHVLSGGGVRLGMASAVVDPELFKGLSITRYKS